MRINSEHFNQIIIEDYDHSAEIKNNLLKRRQKMIILNFLLFLLLFSTIISSVALIKQTKKSSQTIKLLNNKTNIVNRNLNDKITNQIIQFDGKDELKKIMIVSNLQSGSRKITSLNISQSNIDLFQQNKLPTLQNLLLPLTIQTIIYNTLGVNKLNTSFPKLITVRDNNLSHIEQIIFMNSTIKVFQSNILMNLKNISFINTSITMFAQNKLPLLQHILFQNNSQLGLLEIQSQHLKSFDLKNTTISTLTLNNTNLTILTNICNVVNLYLHNSLVHSIDCIDYKSIRILQFTNIRLEKLNITSNTLKRIKLTNLTSLTYFNLVSNITTPMATLSNTGLTNISNQNNSLSQLELNNNKYLTDIENNTFPDLRVFITNSPLQIFNNNSIPKLVVISLNMTFCSFHIFTNNKIPQITNLTIANQTLSSFRNNILTSVKFLILSNNTINDILASQIALQNTWSNSQLIFIDLTLNNISSINRIHDIYEKTFPNAIILI